ncbi:MAG: radical SAM protein [Elusimicrobia bacterium]|nr:radical SAM protein [Elusimicrobiota bacterium]
MISDFIKFKPANLVFVSTYKCTAACKNCCFTCSQDATLPSLPINRILHYLEEGTTGFPSIKLAVFTGGECFLLGKDLVKAIAAAKTHGLQTRCVTNGYWATSKETAVKTLSKLRSAGLDELNFSTGDEHQRYVPFNRIISGVTTACEIGIRTVLVIEGGADSGFTVQTFISTPEIAELLKSPFSKNLIIMTNVWIDFSNKSINGEQQNVALNLSEDTGCSNILESVIISPDERLLSCCGLTLKDIPEMDMGKIQGKGLKKLYEEQANDFLKLWLRVEGPQGIIDNISDDPLNHKFKHPCEACLALFSSDKIREKLIENYTSRVPDIMFKYKFKGLLQKAHDPAFLCNTNGGSHICYGI